MTAIYQQIVDTLSEQLSPAWLDVENESHRHNVPAGSESHFKVTIVSDLFIGMRAVNRHQTICRILSEFLAGPVHALALHTYTADEWAEVSEVPLSPDCRGGDGGARG